MISPTRSHSAPPVAATIHIYRGLMDRATTWRMRIDNPTNWAIVTCGTTVRFTLSDETPSHAVLPLLNTGARIPVCGLIAHYNDTALPAGPDRLGVLLRTILTKRMKMQGFIIFDDYGHRYGEFFQQMSEWLAAGKIKFREDMVDGLENAPQAFMGLLEGRNFGKLVVRVAQDKDTK